MDTDVVLVKAHKLENSFKVNGFDNFALDVQKDTEQGNPATELPGYIESTCNGRQNGCRKFEAINLSWRNLTYKVKSGRATKNIVHNMSGEAHSGTLTAVMGPSGAGKTTLLNLLAGFYDKGYKGEVQINGFVRDQALFNKQSCYVMQEDQLLPVLTVHEAISMSVELRMPSIDAEDKLKKVEQSIEEWGLQDCRNTRTVNLSGGQRKRLAIAQELVNNPPVLFLDEPTSGLDNVTSLMCVQILKRMASVGHTVVCSIHAPSAKIFSYFDMLYMVADGRCIYNGRVDDLLGFLARNGLHCPQFHNPADYICEVASGDYGDCCDKLSREFEVPESRINAFVQESRTKYGGMIMSNELKAEVSRIYTFEVNQFHQFQVLLKRCWLTVFRNQVATSLRVLAYIGFGLLMLMLFYDVGRKASMVTYNVTMFFSLCCVCIFQTILPSVLIFPLDILVLAREQRNCWYSLKVYYLASYVAEIPFLVFPLGILIAIIYYPTGQPMELWRAACFMLFCVQICSVSHSIALIVSAVTKIQTALFVALPVVAPAFFFCGFFVPARFLSPYVRWLTDVSYLYYAYNGLLLSVYGYGRAPLTCDEFICIYEDPAHFLDVAGAADKKIQVMIVVLLGYELLCRLTAFVLLKVRLSRKA